MNPEMFDYRVLAPMGFTALGALVALLVEVLLSPDRRRAAPLRAGERTVREARIGSALAVVATVALLLAIYTAASAFVTGEGGAFNPERPMLQLDALSSLGIVLLSVSSLLCVWLSITYLPALRINNGEYYALLLLSTTGMLVLVSAVDLMILFLGLELMSLPLYALAGFERGKLRSNEAALKYFVMGSFASAVLLYGMALLYGATGRTDLVGIGAGFAAGGTLAHAGLALVVAALVFKVAAFPFHQWAPDVYEGAPTSITAFMSVTVKIAAFLVLLRFLATVVSPAGERLEHLLWLLAFATMIVGNTMAVIQTNVKRLLAYSSIAHAGYLLVGVATGTAEATAAVLFYLFVYLFMTLGVFGVLLSCAQGGIEYETIDDLAGFASRRPGMAAAMTLFLLSLAGIPGTAGFMAKFHLFVAAVNADQIVLVIVGVLTSVVSLFYYLRLPVAMYMRTGTAATDAEPSSSELLVIGVCVIAVLYFGFFPTSDPFATGFRALEVAAHAAEYVH